MYTLYTGNIWTGSKFVTSLVVNDLTGEILGIEPAAPHPHWTRIELPGKITMPGIADRHTHWLFELAQGVSMTRFVGPSAVRDFRAMLKLVIAGQKHGTVVFTDWNDAVITESQVRDVVNTESHGRPGREVLILNASWHAAYASQALLNRVMPEIEAIKDDYRLQGGVKNGLIDEDYLIQLIARLTFETDDALRTALLKRQQLMLSRGITRIFDKMILGFTLLDVLSELSINGELILPTDGAIQPWMMDKGVIPGRVGDNLNIRWLKYLADGAFGNRKARMCFGHQHFPYNNRGGLGVDMLPHVGQFQRDIHRWRELGGDGACIHAIGPGAVLGTTDLFSRVLACGLGNGFTLGFEHMEACPSWAAAHVAALQVAGTRVEVCSQPGFNDDLAAYTDRLPQDVLAMINPYREFKRRGLKWTFGTDGPITGDRTFGAFAQAINRPGGQAIEVADMFGAAIDGHLEVGRPFTAISLDRDSFADPSGMADTTVLETRIGGRVVWSKAA